MICTSIFSPLSSDSLGGLWSKLHELTIKDIIKNDIYFISCVCILIAFKFISIDYVRQQILQSVMQYMTTGEINRFVIIN